METIAVETAWARLRRDWLVTYEDQSWKAVGDDWFALVAFRREQLTRYVAERKVDPISTPTVVIADVNPVDFLAGVWAALLAGWNIALANANWGFQEWQSAYQLIQPHITWHTLSPSNPNLSFLERQKSESPLPQSAFPAILIPTGGSSGQIKFTHHTWQTLTTSVTGFHQHFLPTQTPITACCILPLYHVSGFLQVLRTALTHGQLLLTPFKTLFPPSLIPHLPLPQPSTAAAPFLSLVPTQLERLLNAKQAPLLTQFHAVLLGGAPPWPSLLERAIAHHIPLCLSYGMTETAAMVTATDPQAFLQGCKTLGSGHEMPHASVQIERAGQVLPAGEIGQVVIRSGAIALGYYSAPSPDFAPNTFYTDDLGYLDADGNLHITGRASGKIISGGENIFPDEVEAALRSTGQVNDVCVLGLPHPIWGEAVSAAYVPKDETVSPARLKAALVENTAAGRAALLSRYKVPKYWFALAQLPRNAQGKLNRSALLAQLKTISSSSAQAVTADGDDC